MLTKDQDFKLGKTVC